jgi:hypothetical protein
LVGRAALFGHEETVARRYRMAGHGAMAAI